MFGVRDLSHVYIEIHVVAMLGCGWVRGTWILPSTTPSPGSQIYHSEREVWILCVKIQRLSDLTILLTWELLFLFRFSLQSSSRHSQIILSKILHLIVLLERLCLQDWAIINLLAPNGTISDFITTLKSYYKFLKINPQTFLKKRKNVSLSLSLCGAEEWK